MTVSKKKKYNNILSDFLLMSRGDTLATFLLPYKLPSFSGLIFVSRKNISPKGIHPQQYKKNKLHTESV